MTEISFTLALKRYQQLVEISRQLSSTHDMDGLLQRIIQAAAELVKAQSASILFYDEVRDTLTFQFTTNGKDENVMRGTIIPKESVAGWVVSHKVPIIINNTKKSPQFNDKYETYIQIPAKQIIAVPLIAQDQVIGVLEVINKTAGEFNDEDQSLMLALSAQAAMTIETTRLSNQATLITELVHELRTPLNSIQTIAYLLQRPDINDDQRKKFGNTIQNEIQRLNEMATAYLDLARLEAGQMPFHINTFSFPELVKSCVEVIKPRAVMQKINIQQNLDPDIPLIQADEEKIRQVLLNLLSNALKFNQEGGSIIIHAEKDSSDLVFLVSDTGKGIPEADLPKIFTRFFRSSHTERVSSGTGLGLSICKRLVECQKGTIEVISEVDKGSTFTVHIPLKVDITC